MFSHKMKFRHLSLDYWTKNLSLLLTIAIILIINAILFITRAIGFKVSLSERSMAVEISDLTAILQQRENATVGRNLQTQR
jgi:hypothetical protein